MKETGQNLILFASWKDLRLLYSDQSLINGQRKLMQLCRMKAEEKWQVSIWVANLYFFHFYLPLLIFFITKYPSVALLKRQGFNFKGPAKAAPVKQEPLPQIDCTGNLQVNKLPFLTKKFATRLHPVIAVDLSFIELL